MNNEYDYYESPQHFSDTDKNPRSKKSVSLMTLIACMLITALVGGGVGGFLVNSMQPKIQAPITTPGAAPSAQAASVEAMPQNTPAAGLVSTSGNAGHYTKAQIVEMAAPSIVGIDIEASSGMNWYGQELLQMGSGSGVIVSSDGYIITNDHVVNGASKIKVYLSDDTEYDATLVGRDAKTDLAVIKIEATGLRPVVLGDSAMMKVGDDVVAIGNPLGELRGTATSGMISALSRTIDIEGQSMTLMQTDAAINPGNSGGGLFNDKGELIGVINAKVASSSTEGLGFAIPVNDAKAVISDLMDLGYVSGRAFLGVIPQEIAVRTADGSSDRGGLDGYFGFYGNSRGGYEIRVQVAQVVLGGAAETAGIQSGDIILQVGEKNITSSSDLSAAILEYKVGDVANIKVQRNDQEMNITVTFGEYVPK